MGGDKHRSKKGGYVGGFLHLFDWKSKSRKKLFPSKSDLQERSKVKEGTYGNLPTSRSCLTDNDDETLMGSSIKGSDYSCASSMTDDGDGYVNKAPGVVARLMGLDSLPTSYFRESYSSSPFIDSKSLPGTSIQKTVEIKQQKMLNSPIKKFQTEVLPPKSAKPIPITQNKLLSPIKSPGFVLLKDASDIMEAAAKIIDPGLQASSSTSMSKTRLIGSSSVPLKVKDLKEKAEGVQKPSRFPKGHCRSRSSSNDLKDGVGVNNKVKSISLAVQAKVNVQKREGLIQNAIRSSSGQKDPTVKNPQNCQKKPSTNNSSTALMQNSQKQNCLVDKENIPSKPLPKVQGRRTKPVDLSPGRHITASKTTDKSKVTDHGSKSVSRKNRLKEGISISHQDKNDRQISLKSATERRVACGEDNKGKGVDVVSFTFKAPISRSMSNEKLRQTSQKSVNECGGDALSVLLEQKLKEFTHIVDSIGDSSSSSSSSSICQDSVSDLESVTTTQISYYSKNQKAAQSIPPRHHHHQRLQIKEEMNLEPSIMLGKHHPSPVSVLESSSMTESCNSSESTTITTASSVQADANLSDTDSSTSRTITPTTSGWELEYVKEILSDMEPMFEDYAIGRSQHFVNPRLFHRIESAQNHFDGGDVGKQTRKVLFDFVNESMDLRCTKGGCGYEKGMKTKMRRKEWLEEEIYGELEGWRGWEDCMVDDLVEKDMSNQYGKWVEFDVEVFEVGVNIEGRILSSLINEVVADMLRL